MVGGVWWWRGGVQRSLTKSFRRPKSGLLFLFWRGQASVRCKMRAAPSKPLPNTTIHVRFFFLLRVFLVFLLLCFLFLFVLCCRRCPFTTDTLILDPSTSSPPPFLP